MTTITLPSNVRGRAAQPVRPGLTIKAVLMGQIPLIDGSHVHEAAIVDICNVYQDLINKENQTRDRVHKIRVITYSSFIHIFKFARYLKLVEFVRDEPMLFPPSRGHLYSVRKNKVVRAKISTRRIYKLTQTGIDDDRAWLDLCKAYRENWEVPVKIERIIPPPVIEEEPPMPEEVLPPKAAKPVKKAPAVKAPPAAKTPVKAPAKAPAKKAPPTSFTPYKWSDQPSLSQYKKLRAHMYILNEIGAEDPKVKKELYRLAMNSGDWGAEMDYLIEGAEEHENEKLIDRYTELKEYLDELYEALSDESIDAAIEALDSLVDAASSK